MIPLQKTKSIVTAQCAQSPICFLRGVFAFHLLFSYMVDHVALFASFIIASAVSLLLVMSHIRLVTVWKFAVLQAGFWQFIFLALFTYAHFFEGYTGLTVTIGAILKLGGSYADDRPDRLGKRSRSAKREESTAESRCPGVII